MHNFSFNFLAVVSGLSGKGGPSGTTSDSDSSSGLLVGALIGVGIVLMLIGALVGVALTFCGLWFLMKKKKRRGGYGVSGGVGEKEMESREEVYEEPEPAAASETVFALSGNQAYCQVTSQQQGGR